VRSIAAETFEPLAKKAISNLAVVAEMKRAITGLQDEFRGKFKQIDYELKEKAVLSWVKEQLNEHEEQIQTEARILGDRCEVIGSSATTAMVTVEHVGARVQLLVSNLIIIFSSLCIIATTRWTPGRQGRRRRAAPRPRLQTDRHQN